MTFHGRPHDEEMRVRRCVACLGAGETLHREKTKVGEHATKIENVSKACASCNGFGWQWFDGNAPTRCVGTPKGTATVACGRRRICSVCPYPPPVEKLDAFG